MKNAIVQEVSRLELEVSTSEARRIDYALTNFFTFAGDILLERISTEMLKGYMRKRLTDKAAKATIQRELYSLVRMLKQYGFQVDKPKVTQGKKTKQRPFTEDELKLFFSHCKPQHRVLFMLMLTTGARSAELIPSPRSTHKPLLKEEVDPETGIISLRVAKLKAGQEEKVRRIKIPEQFMNELVAYAKTIPGPFVFLPNQSLKNLFNRILEDAGIAKVNVLGKKLTAHSFRHTYGTRMAKLIGNNPFVLKEMMGHCQIKTTEIYCHPDAPELVMPMPFFDEESKGGMEKGVWKKENPPVQEAG